ncbi:hypothetical protein B0H13DRAFT_2350529 [Mycena leptocephala]|nr:hypothetical protein B0H13DRAFT_2350529 [Mycena leptocephala]
MHVGGAYPPGARALQQPRRYGVLAISCPGGVLQLGRWAWVISGLPALMPLGHGHCIVIARPRPSVSRVGSPPSSLPFSLCARALSPLIPRQSSTGRFTSVFPFTFTSPCPRPRPRRCSSCYATQHTHLSPRPPASPAWAVDAVGDADVDPLPSPLPGLASLGARTLASDPSPDQCVMALDCASHPPQTGAVSSNMVERHLDGKDEERMCIGGAYLGVLWRAAGEDELGLEFLACLQIYFGVSL